MEEDALVRRMLIDHLQFFAHLRHEISPEDLSERHNVKPLCLLIRYRCLMGEGQLTALDNAGQRHRVTNIDAGVPPAS